MDGWIVGLVFFPYEEKGDATYKEKTFHEQETDQFG